MTNKPKHQAQWKRLADMPVPKWEPASIVLDDKMFMEGTKMELSRGKIFTFLILREPRMEAGRNYKIFQVALAM